MKKLDKDVVHLRLEQTPVVEGRSWLSTRKPARFAPWSAGMISPAANTIVRCLPAVSRGRHFKNHLCDDESGMSPATVVVWMPRGV